MFKQTFPDVQRQTIEKLLPEVSSAVRAASILPSLSRVIEELVLNSLDAGSSNIEVKVNMTTFSFDVKDDGECITRTPKISYLISD